MQEIITDTGMINLELWQSDMTDCFYQVAGLLILMAIQGEHPSVTHAPAEVHVVCVCVCVSMCVHASLCAGVYAGAWCKCLCVLCIAYA